MKGLYLNIKVSDILFMLAMVFVLGIPGPSQMKAIAISVFFGYMVLVKLKNYRSIRNNLHIIGAFLFLGYTYISRKWAFYPAAVSEQLTNVMWTVMLATATSTYVIFNNYNEKDITKRLIPIAIILLANVLFKGSFSDNRLSIGINENTFGRLSAGIFCFLFYQCKQQKWRNLFLDILTAVLLLFAFLSGSRTSVLMAAIYVLVILMFEHPTKNAVKIIGNLLIVVFLCGAGYFCLMNIGFLYNSIGNRVESLLAVFTGGSQEDGSTISRLNMMELARGIFLEHPWLGIGMNNFKYATYYNTYAHSNYYELAACLGIFGLILYYVPLLVYFKKTISKWIKNENAMIVPLVVLGTFLIGDLGGVSYFSTISHVFVGLAIGFVSNQNHIEELER